MNPSLPVDVYGDLLHVGNRRKWGRVRDAVKHSGLSRTQIYELIRDGSIESFIFKRHPGAVSGCRIVNLQSLDEFLDRMAQAAKQQEAL
jgi:hypothetical protein